MGSSKTIFSLLLFFFLCSPHFTASAKNCRNNKCGKGEPVISYPFRIIGRQDKRCGFPGFDLTCDELKRTVLELPFSGRFFVKSITRFNLQNMYNEIQLQDPDDCLARRYLNQVNLSGTPFFGINFIGYSFYNCPSNAINYYSGYSTTRISCLSSSKHTVVATSTKNILNKYFISVGIIISILFGSVMYCTRCCGIYSHSQYVPSGAVQTTPQSVDITTTGLGGPAIQSFPMVVLGESGRLPDPNINTCSICLSEYQPKETLKTLPVCNHCFHADCIDVWLHLKSTCPVCRKSPVPSSG
ncbi:hypothetical protein MKW94_008496 [Papaver nudicaule]|uniref:RING-type E3 ubiquitin transferase n=1 Tax=Papaver nudicaule TaxID=74823 RepID=A0AA42B4G8_PAPNU|nr:hypothetical protein [Papaver nudicaule]